MRLISLTLGVDLSSAKYPTVNRFVFRRSRQPLELGWNAVKSIDWPQRRILVEDLDAASSTSADELEQAVLLDRDIVDALILDLPPTRWR
jgi:hypothetical protein